MYLSFLNTEYYFEWQTETDEEMKEIYFEQSGYEKFVENLNAFVASRGVLSKIQTPLETLKSAITNVIGESENLSIDRDIEAAEELLKRRQKTLLAGKRRIHAEISELANTLCSKIKAEGSSAANSIVPGITQEEATRKIEAAQLQAETYINSYENQIFDRLAEICENVNKEISLIDRSHFAFNVQTNLDNKALAPVKQQDRLSEFYNKNKEFSSILSNVGMTAKGAAAVKVSLPILGELKAAGVVKDVGHFFGFKFAPWGATNLLKGAFNVLGWIGIAMTAYQILNKMFGKDKQREMEEELRKAREQIQSEFNRGAEEVRNTIISAATNKMGELTAPAFTDAENKLAEFRRKKDQLKSLGHSLQKILADVETLMDEVQKTVKV